MEKPKISVIIPFKDDRYLIDNTVGRINSGYNTDDIDIVIVDDGSHEPLEEDHFGDNGNVRIYRLRQNKGVGHAFDYGVKKALSDNLLLMGSDVLVEDGKWIDKAIDNITEHPKSITCSVCVKISNLHDRWDDKGRLYGADILFKTDKPDFLQCKWITDKRGEDSYEIPSVLGACYAVSKRWYMQIGGWGWMKGTGGLDKEESKWSGHRVWGGLEPMISLKSWFAGGSCRIDPSWETAHIFHRNDHVEQVRPKRWDLYWFNKLYMANTLFSKEQTDKLESFLPSNKSANVAKVMIKRNKRAIAKEKTYNESVKQDGYTLFEDLFNYDLSWLR